MLIYNVCTIDGLTNGLTGSVIDIERRKNEKENVRYNDGEQLLGTFYLGESYLIQ